MICKIKNILYIFFILFVISSVSFGSNSVNEMDRLTDAYIYNKAISAYNLENYSRSKLLFEELEISNTKYTLTFFILGKIYRTDAYLDNDKAIHYFEKYIKINFDSKNEITQYRVAIAKTHLAYLCLRTKDFKKSKEYVDELIVSEYKNNNDVRVCYGIVYNAIGYNFINLKRYSDAVILFEKSMSIWPNSQEVYNNIIFCYYRLIELESDEQYKKTLCVKIDKYLKKSLEINPKNEATKKNQIYYKDICEKCSK